MKVYFIMCSTGVCASVCACVQLYVEALVQYLAHTEEVVCPTSEKLHLLQQHVFATYL